jgi:hypothetical protein
VTASRRSIFRWLFVLVPALVVGFAVAPTSAAESDFIVVVQAANPVNKLNRQDVSRLFLRKTQSFPNGLAADPVDQTGDSPVREAFTTAVHGRAVAAVLSFWNQQVFTGRGLPPAQLKGDAAVLHYVATHSGGIGYVHRTTTLPSDVKSVEVE